LEEEVPDVDEVVPEGWVVVNEVSSAMRLIESVMLIARMANTKAAT